ncbi:hypothetical protein KC960_05420 [Candidatus Saccharibacteria bacterium]|nr:hypothetical protein [Candidatus Saccharibacteria bacterium]MCA9346900.1 hypothetical protein [Candidatus Saccharibacteria bacterium]
MFIVIFLAILIFLILNIKKAKFMKNRYTLVLAILSTVWWVFLVIGQMRMTLICDPGDDFCNSGNTFTGDLMWGSMLAMYTLLFVWVPFTLVTYFVTKRNTHPKKGKIKL